MNSKTIWAVVIIILILGGGYWLLTNKGSGEMMQGGEQGGASSTTATSNSSPAANAETASSDPALVGTWQSTEDANFTRTFTADGHVTDAYKGQADATETGTFVVVDPTKEDVGVPVDTVLGMTVLKINFPSGPLYFAVQSESASSLKLIYLGRGNILSFTKVSAQ